MATQRVPALQFPSQHSPKVEPVTQERLAEIIMLRQQIESLETQVGEALTDVKAALESGAEVEPGLFRASLKVTERSNVSWKSELFIRLFRCERIGKRVSLEEAIRCVGEGRK